MDIRHPRAPVEVLSTLACRRSFVVVSGGRAGFAIEREWGWRRPKERPLETVSLSPGERLWNLTVQKQGGARANLNALPWKALYRHSLMDHFLTVMGDDGKYRPLQVRRVMIGPC